jgi:aryl-alcohol dehydrogenase-like predicted oxidoreductase
VDQTRLGAAGPLVSRLGLGTGYFGTRIVGTTARRMIDRFVDAGGTLIDTADIYGRGVLRPGVADAGASELLLGDVLSGRRDRVVLASKVGQRAIAGPGPDKVGLSRAMIERSVDASLRRLRTDWIDLYQCHLADPHTPLDETLGAMTDLVTKGKIRYAGVSNWDGWQVLEATLTASRDGNTEMVSDQVWYNVIDRQVENGVVPACRRAGVGVIAYSPLAGGFLLGGYRRSDSRPAAGRRLIADDQLRHTSWDGLATPRGFDTIEAIDGLARALDMAPSTIALRWLLDAGAADVVLVGPRDEAQLAEFLLANDATVPTDALAQLTHVSEPEHSYPRSFTDAYARRESPVYGGLPDFGNWDE